MCMCERQTCLFLCLSSKRHFLVEFSKCCLHSKYINLENTYNKYFPVYIICLFIVLAHVFPEGFLFFNIISFCNNSRFTEKLPRQYRGFLYTCHPACPDVNILYTHGVFAQMKQYPNFLRLPCSCAAERIKQL